VNPELSDAFDLSIPEGYSRKDVQQTLSLTLNSEFPYPEFLVAE